ncbi:MAG: CHASE4 domain-containing protein, partial [bacterium]
MFLIRHRNLKHLHAIAEQYLYRLTKTAQSIMELKSQSLINFTFDNTYWDEMVEFVRHPDPEWARINLKEAIPPFNIDAVWVFDRSNHLLYTISTVEDSMAGVFPIRALEKGIMEKGYFHHFYQWGSQGLWEFSTAPIQPSTDIQRQTSPQGFLFTARFWSSRYLEEIASPIESQVALVKPSGAPPAPFKDLPTGLIITYLPLTDLSQDTVAWVKIEHISQAIQNYYHTMTRDQRNFAFVGIVFLGLLALLLYYWVNRPLERISRAIRNGSSQGVISLIRSPTEFGEIANLWLNYLQQTEALHAAELRYRSFVELTSEGICCWDIVPPCPTHLPTEDQVLWIYNNGILSECNTAFAQSWGMKTAQEALGKPISALINLNDPQYSEPLFRFVKNQYRLSGVEVEKRISEETVSYSLVSLLGIKDESGVYRIWGIHHDITPLKRTQEELRRRTRLYHLLSETNRLITAVRTPEELYRQIVQLAVEKGGYKMAWVGLVDLKEGKIRSVASAGDTDCLIEEVPLSPQENSPYSLYPTVRAYRDGEVVYTADLRTDPLMEAYRDEALARGYFS